MSLPGGCCPVRKIPIFMVHMLHQSRGGRKRDGLPEEDPDMAGQPRIGILGLGTMGGPMARRLAQSGFAVTGYDPNAKSAERAKAAGVSLDASPLRVALQSDFVMSSLPDPATVRRAYLGNDGG